jgi:hypothetical protein
MRSLHVATPPIMRPFKLKLLKIVPQHGINNEAEKLQIVTK